MKKLGNKGATHLLAILVVVITAAIGGTFMLVSSHADSVDPVGASASVSSRKCKDGKKLVNARPADYISGKYKSQAKRNKGLLCLQNPDGRETVTGPNNNTITDFYKCSGSSVFAYDKTNPPGTEYILRWKLQSYNGGNELHEKKTYYCVNKKDLYAGRLANGVDVKNATSYMIANRDTHVYKMFPAFPKNDPCSGAKLKYSGCKQNYFFSYFQGGDIRHR